MRCPNCNSDVPASAKFCAECGTRIDGLCASCGAANPAGAKFCMQCGTAFRGAGADSSRPASQAPTAPASASSLAEIPSGNIAEGERKTITALFADIKGSMDLIEDLDPEEARAIVDPALRIMIDAVRRYDGYIVQSTGDGIFALFGAPVAHEDHPH